MISNSKDSHNQKQAPQIDAAKYPKPSIETLKQSLSALAYQVTQESATERPYSHPYDHHFQAGIYVDITTGEPLFVSTDKFDSGCGWPAFARPISEEVLQYRKDYSHGMLRVEVRSRTGDAHLGHVFDDGPKALGGTRFCINGAALRFVPQADMEKEGYGNLLYLLEESVT